MAGSGRWNREKDVKNMVPIDVWQEPVEPFGPRVRRHDGRAKPAVRLSDMPATITIVDKDGC